MIIFVQIICIFLAVLLVILVILQQGKGSDLGSAFGGGSSNSMFGALGPSNLLGRLTWIIGSLFLIFAMTQAVLLKNLNDQDDFNFPEQENVIEETDELDSLPTE
jgi:preprotein translocase subunit SecG|tara:strand:+ start:494 stop:808 length:315 start_codon:yes stop_codon:yes gene_type:complete